MTDTKNKTTGSTSFLPILSIFNLLLLEETQDDIPKDLDHPGKKQTIKLLSIVTKSTCTIARTLSRHFGTSSTTHFM